MAKPYVLKPGDMLRIEVIEDNSLNRNALVLPDGTIAFPMVGQIAAAGRTLTHVREALTAGLAPNFVQRPSLHVAVASVARPEAPMRTVTTAQVSQKVITVFGMGELGAPGKQQLPLGSSLMQFLAQAGGTTPFAATKRVQVRRTAAAGGAIVTYRVNVKQLMRDGGKSFLLVPGDVVIVPQRRLFE
ncbi:polysaccharide biosynthesis/export family protein [Litoreibacter meonggei]|uniref:polysaccharide biosynthesis/export family protein n=1 Tax=Litoreibacter meonggei TaxID=1049199 RepID=UPI0011C376D1|nr:polysaccharide biosynthesis/export family protein [Litoreibacter meonggei]